MEQFWNMISWVDAHGELIVAGIISVIAILMVTVWRKKFF